MPSERVTEVAFHFGAPDKLAYACRLLRKAVGAGSTVLVTAEEADLQRLDVDLWAVSPTDFLSHATFSDPVSAQARSQVMLSVTVDPSQTQRDVLVNLADAMSQGFERFKRVIEVVGTDEFDRNAARVRWKRYTELGYVISRHDLALKG